MLGPSSPVAGYATVFEPAADDDAAPPHPLLVAARRKLDAARVLVDQDHAGAGVELLAGASLEAAAVLAGQAQAPGQAEAGVWLYQQALPQGWLSGDQVNLVLRALSLAQATELPEAMTRELAADVEAFVAAAASLQG